MRSANRRGSALLVVIGMISFMIVSAVAFSAYMRHSRLPSSFLRQTDASRLLVKAALANAIDEVDAAIGCNPHPNVGQTSSLYPRSGGTSYQRNSWIGRVYMGTNTSAGVSASEDTTVTPLCLEALAYIPPPLVNEVRYYSRRTRTACWHQLDFDAGRYAYCAVDVSDYFDINAIGAGPRSSEPDSKVSLAYLFEDVQHTSTGGGPLGTAAAWDSFMEAFRGNAKVPLVSLADWNLAMNNGGPFKPPFCNYVVNNGGNFYGISSDGDDAEKFRMMTFVTDSCLPAADSQASRMNYDLCDEQYQPWTDGQLQQTNPNLFDTLHEGMSLGLKRLSGHIPNPALAALYDYLDEDRVPISLALPTVERAPMICGIQTDFNGTLAVKATEPKYEYDPKERPDQPTRMTTKTVRYNLDGSQLLGGAIGVRALVAYPFRHGDEVPSDFNVEGSLAIFLTSEDMGLRPDAAVDRLKALDENFFSTASVKDGVIILPLKSQQVGFTKDMKDEKEALKIVEFTVDEVGSVIAALEKEEQALFKGRFKVEQRAEKILDANGQVTGYDWDNPTPANTSIEDVSSKAQVLEAVCNFRPHKADGSEDAAYGDAAKGQKLGDLFRSGGGDLKLNVAVTLRVRLGDKVVDVVPACGASDDAFNRRQNWTDLSRDLLVEVCGQDTPMLRLDTGGTFKWGKTGFADAQTKLATVAAVPKVAMIGDPRYNYAPESWFASGNDTLSADGWLEVCGAHSADGDIFMQVSDQCRLQSVYELANLPRVGERGLFKPGDQMRGTLASPSSIQRKTIGSQTEALNAGFMWKTYDPFGRYEDCPDGDGFEELCMVSDGSGYKVCPYSDSTNVLMAAFANTPLDWRCASVNNKEISADTATAFNGKYAWNAASGSGTKILWQNLEEVAGEFMAEIRANHSGDAYEESWEEAFRCLGWRTAKNGWSDSPNYILDGLDLEGSGKVFNSDRKFLYGFWHDSFAPRQQLFLIFVRAEPVMMGGGAIGQTPPQLGARAVALVWRDPRCWCTACGRYHFPESTGVIDVNAPHRTRVLFYRQFD